MLPSLFLAGVAPKPRPDDLRSSDWASLPPGPGDILALPQHWLVAAE